MSLDPTYDRHVAQMRVLIDEYGAQNAIHALELAFEQEAESSPKLADYHNQIKDKLADLYYQIQAMK